MGVKQNKQHLQTLGRPCRRDKNRAERKLHSGTNPSRNVLPPVCIQTKRRTAGHRDGICKFRVRFLRHLSRERRRNARRKDGRRRPDTLRHKMGGRSQACIFKIRRTPDRIYRCPGRRQYADYTRLCRIGQYVRIRLLRQLNFN